MCEFDELKFTHFQIQLSRLESRWSPISCRIVFSGSESTRKFCYTVNWKKYVGPEGEDFYLKSRRGDKMKNFNHNSRNVSYSSIKIDLTQLLTHKHFSSHKNTFWNSKWSCPRPCPRLQKIGVHRSLATDELDSISVKMGTRILSGFCNKL